MTKTLSLTDAQQQLAAATATVDQLKAKILDEGPGTVTAEELGGAALAVEHANLAVQHAVQQAQAQAAAERQEQLQLLKAQILDKASSVGIALDAMEQLEEAAAILIRACGGRQQLIAQATAAMRKAGVPRHDDGQADQHAGLGWTQAAMGRGDTIHVDARSITTVSPGLLIAAALDRAARQAGRSLQILQPAVDVPGVQQALAQDPETWLRKRY
ncbi:hypothetical protein [Streptomyces europaeiscabiei]|uniref:hypothetical protein n=1 Tax=Streptomyces europaeiscabiei TaxID=146819 RepID=UPI000765E50D|nr:hypothetical protein [Streptomyces europaeiscabiei]